MEAKRKSKQRFEKLFMARPPTFLQFYINKKIKFYSIPPKNPFLRIFCFCFFITHFRTFSDEYRWYEHLSALISYPHLFSHHRYAMRLHLQLIIRPYYHHSYLILLQHLHHFYLLTKEKSLGVGYIILL